MSGVIFETWVVAELLKSYWHSGKQAPLYYYRDKNQKEIDVLIVLDGTIYPIEIKKIATPGRDAVKHFSVLEKLGANGGPRDGGLPMQRADADHGQRRGVTSEAGGMMG
jgi:hypothetical protein